MTAPPTRFAWCSAESDRPGGPRDLQERRRRAGAVSFSGIGALRRRPYADQVWVGDITYLSVAGAWRYLAVVMDRYSRRIIGWSLGAHKDARLTLAALTRAVCNRRPRSGAIFHTDRGIEYAAYAFRRRLAALGFVQSMNRPGTIADNAHMEAFFHSMKTDVVHGARFVSDDALDRLLRSYIPYYNGVRLHSGIGYRAE